MTNVLKSIASPVLVAPMAGGPITPEVVRAAAAAGSLGTLAVGTTTAEATASLLDEMDGICFGLNLFAPQPPLTESELAQAQALADAEGVELGTPDYTSAWDAKLEVALSHRNRPAVVWSMFGAPSTEGVARIHAAGSEAWATVTTPEEAREAAARGIDALCVQGPEAGGHRGVWDYAAEPDWRALGELVAAVHAVVPDMPLIAAGGLRTAADVAEALSWPGVVKVSCGSAFLLADEAGTSAWNRSLLEHPGKTTSSRAFSGRYARGLATEYTRTHPGVGPVYPHINAILKARRAAQDPAVAYCLVGIRPGELRGGSVAEILARLS